MKGSQRHLAVVAVSGLVLAAVAAVAAPSPATGAAAQESSVTRGQLVGPIEPVLGTDGHLPTSSEAFQPQPSESTGGSPVLPEAGAESVSPPDGRVRVTNTTDYPHRAVGQIELVQDGLGFICTGWLIDRNSILASGHCLYDPTGPPNDIIESATFFAGRNRNVDPFGGCDVEEGLSPNAWRLNRNAVHDWAVMNLYTDVPACAALGDTTGWFGMRTTPTNALNNQFATVQGYPGDRPPGTHVKMRGRIHHGTANSLFYPMDTFGGQSGSPIWQQRNSGSCTGACGVGLHSYGFPPGLPPAQRLNSGPRLTAGRIGQIMAFADNNGT